MNAIENASKLKNEIQYLSMIRNDEKKISNPSKRNYASFWAQVKEINNLFKTLKPLSRDDRAELWDVGVSGHLRSGLTSFT